MKPSCPRFSFFVRLLGRRKEGTFPVVWWEGGVSTISRGWATERSLVSRS